MVQTTIGPSEDFLPNHLAKSKVPHHNWGCETPLLQEKLPQYGSPYLLGKLSGTHGTQTQMGVKIDGKNWPKLWGFPLEKTLNWQSSSHIWWLQKSETNTKDASVDHGPVYYQLIMARSILDMGATVASCCYLGASWEKVSLIYWTPLTTHLFGIWYVNMSPNLTPLHHITSVVLGESTWRCS